jgi:hypothetical protein
MHEYEEVFYLYTYGPDGSDEQRRSEHLSYGDADRAGRAWLEENETGEYQVKKFTRRSS